MNEMLDSIKQRLNPNSDYYSFLLSLIIFYVVFWSVTGVFGFVIYTIVTKL